MDCCAASALDRQFDEKKAQSELNEYLKDGLEKPARKVADLLKARGVSGASLLEVGAGLGGLHLELLKAGASRAIDVDASSGYLKVARSLAEKLGLAEAVAYRHADFAAEADSVPGADIVILHRVVCCYPDMPGLVRASARHTRRLLALTYPRYTWWVRLGVRLADAFLALFRNPFRVYAHPPDHIRAIAAEEGLRPSTVTRSGLWEIAVLERLPGTT